MFIFFPEFSEDNLWSDSKTEYFVLKRKIKFKSCTDSIEKLFDSLMSFAKAWAAFISID